MRIGLHRRYYFQMPYRRKKRCCTVGIAFILLFCIASACGIFYKNVRPVFLKRVEHYASEIANKIINQAVGQVFAGEDIEYNDLIKLERNSAGEVISIQSNTAKINRLKAQIEQTVRSELENNTDGYVSIPVGNVLKQEVFAAAGPKIKIKVNLSGTAAMDFQEEFTAVGINQTKHKIYLDTELTISILSVTMSQEQTIHNQIPIAETVIVGSVPHYYSNSGNEIPAIADK